MGFWFQKVSGLRVRKILSNFFITNSLRRSAIVCCIVIFTDFTAFSFFAEFTARAGLCTTCAGNGAIPFKQHIIRWWLEGVCTSSCITFKWFGCTCRVCSNIAQNTLLSIFRFLNRHNVGFRPSHVAWKTLPLKNYADRTVLQQSTEQWSWHNFILEADDNL